MKVLKIIGGVILAAVAIFLITGAVSRKDFKTSQSIVIDASPAQIYNVVNDLSTWQSWSPWAEEDPTVTPKMGSTYVGKGGSYSWTSEKMGAGECTITESIKNKQIDNHLNFGPQGEADAKFTFEPKETGTETTWHFHSHVDFPMNAMMVFMGFEGMMNKSYSRGLELLKGKVESMPKAAALEVQIIEYPGQNFVINRKTVAIKDVASFYQKNLPSLFEACTKGKLKMTGMPSGLFYSWDEENASSDMAAAIPISSDAIPKGMTLEKTNAGKALQIDYYGDYSGTSKAHDAMDVYLKANNLKFSWPVIETYVTDPTTEPDPSKWLTKVIYPLQ